MNLTSPKHPWQRLVAAARRTQEERELAAPYGFSTRVVALALSQERKLGSLLERFSLRALGVACALTVVTLSANLPLVTSLFTTVEEVSLSPSDDPIADLVQAVTID